MGDQAVFFVRCARMSYSDVRDGIRRHFFGAEGFLPFGANGVAFFHGHRRVLQKHLWAFAAAPREEAQKMILANGLRACGGVRTALAIGNATACVVHGLPRLTSVSMPDRSGDFQPA